MIFIPKHTREYYQKHYVELGWSTYTIAKASKTYANKINRDLVHYGFALRTKSEAQINALETGVHKHPTKGTHRNEFTKEVISNALAEKWSQLSPEEKERRSVGARERWNEASKEEREAFSHKAAIGVRKAAEEGSKIEKFLLMMLRKDGMNVQFHREGLVYKEGLQVDIFLPEEKVCLELDGISHYEPIWGEEALLKMQERDKEKNGLLLSAGYTIIRVKIAHKNFSQKICRHIYECIYSVLTDIRFNKGNRLIFIDTERGKDGKTTEG